jgi:hypothetical protein
MDAKLKQMEQERQERIAAAAPEPPDVAALARLVTGKIQEAAVERPAVVNFLKRAGFTHLFITKLLETGTQASVPHVIRLAALHLHLERSQLWNDAARAAVGHIE